MPGTPRGSLLRRLHGIERPTGPGADDAVAALRQVGIEPTVARWSRPATADYGTFEEMVEVTRRRLCLPPEAVPAVVAALRELQVDADTPPDLGTAGRNRRGLAATG